MKQNQFIENLLSEILKYKNMINYKIIQGYGTKYDLSDAESLAYYLTISLGQIYLQIKRTGEGSWIDSNYWEAELLSKVLPQNIRNGLTRDVLNPIRENFSIEDKPSDDSIVFYNYRELLDPSYDSSKNKSSDETNRYGFFDDEELKEKEFTTEDAIRRAFPKLNLDIVHTITKWYENENAIEDFDNISEFSDYIASDIYDMLDAATNVSEKKEVVKNLKKYGYVK